MKQFLRPFGRRLKSAEYVVRNALGLTESGDKLVRDSQAYWSRPETEAQRFNSHWRGQGDFSDDARWQEVGREHLVLFEEFAGALGMKLPLSRIVEWGCGGGANAVHFAPLAREFVGVEIAEASLDECGRQLSAASPETKYVPVLITAENPEAACDSLEEGCDLFLCVYVFELLPSTEYARRVLKVAHRLLRPGGVAMIQVKYRTMDLRTAPRRWGYVKNLAHNTTYAIDEFWLEAEAAGFRPKLVSLVPKQPLVRDERYAYFALQRGEGLPPSSARVADTTSQRLGLRRGISLSVRRTTPSAALRDDAGATPDRRSE